MLLSPGVYSIELNQPDSKEIKPGQPLSLSCKVSGYSLSSCSYCTNWIRQASGGLEWIGRVCCSGGTDYSEKLKNKFSISRDTSSSTVTITGQNMQTEDTAVYYCARESQAATALRRYNQEIAISLCLLSK
uniref:Ig-like domain-containing protein n=1 Tax=Cyprinus carpio TaxID=7962 RepID=A0A8C1VJV9_CYPCA